MARWTKLGLIAGGGALPLRVVQSCLEHGAPHFVIRLAGLANNSLDAFEGETCGLGEAGKIIRLLKANNCDAVAMCGLVSRPDFSGLSLDWRGAAIMPRIVAAAGKGDGAILSVLVDTFEAEGFIVVGAEEVMGRLAVEEGAMSAISPTADDWADIRKAAEVVKALGPFDVGQGAVVIRGQVIAIEAAEGTDAMLERCAALRSSSSGVADGGVLVKRPKPGQELRVDLPTIGIRTIINAANAGLAGVAVEAGAALLVDAAEAVAEANARGLFLYGFTNDELLP